MYEKQIAESLEKISNLQLRIDFLRNSIQKIKDYDALQPPEKLVSWAKHQGYMYKPEIIKQLIKHNADQRFIDAFKQNTMFSWTDKEVEDTISAVKEQHDI